MIFKKTLLTKNLITKKNLNKNFKKYYTIILKSCNEFLT